MQEMLNYVNISFLLPKRAVHIFCLKNILFIDC